MILVLLLACMSAKNRPPDYHIVQPSHLWQALPQSPADHAWKQPQLSSTIYVKANCGSYFEDRNLSDSILSLTRGLQVSEPISQEELRIANRKAMFQVMDSNIDGIPIRLGMIVLSKNNCLYDFLMIAPQKNFAEGIADFLNMAQSLDTNPSVKP